MPRVENRFTELLAAKRRREGKSWRYREIAEATGLSTSTLSRFAQQKHEQFDGDTLAKLCDFLGCSLGELLILVNNEDESEGQPAAVSVR